jgi:hypothetical protein
MLHKKQIKNAYKKISYTSSGKLFSVLLLLRRCRPKTTNKQKHIDIIKQMVNGISDRSIILNSIFQVNKLQKVRKKTGQIKSSLHAKQAIGTVSWRLYQNKSKKETGIFDC